MGLLDDFNPDNYTSREIEIVERLLVRQLRRDLMDVKLELQARVERDARYSLRRNADSEEWKRSCLEHWKKFREQWIESRKQRSYAWTKELDADELEIANRVLMDEIELPITYLHGLEASCLIDSWALEREYHYQQPAWLREATMEAVKKHEHEVWAEKERSETLRMEHQLMRNEGLERYPGLYE